MVGSNIGSDGPEVAVRATAAQDSEAFLEHKVNIFQLQMMSPRWHATFG